MSPTRRQVLASIAGIAAASTLDTSAASRPAPDPSMTTTGCGSTWTEQGALREERSGAWSLVHRNGSWELRRYAYWHDRSVCLPDAHENALVLTPEQAAAIQAMGLTPHPPARPPVLRVRRHQTTDPDRYAFGLDWFNHQNARWVLLSADSSIEASFAPMNCLIRLEEIWTKDGPTETPYHEDIYLAQLPREAFAGFRLTPAEILRGVA